MEDRMKRLIAALFLTLAAATTAQAVIYNYVQVTTTTALSPALQNGAVRVSSGTILNLRSSTFTVTTALQDANLTAGTSGYVMTSRGSTLGPQWLPVAITPGQLPGTATNDSATAGNVGEYISSYTFSNAFTATAWKDLTSIPLTAGDWDVWGQLSSLGVGANTNVNLAITTTAGNSGAGQTEGLNYIRSGALAATYNMATLTTRLSLSSPATAYLKAILDSSTAGCTAGIQARRVR